MNGDDIIELNVGGRHFAACRKTLCAEPGSKLAAMFDGRGTVKIPPKDLDDRFFLDFDPEYFSVILEHLRQTQRHGVHIIGPVSLSGIYGETNAQRWSRQALSLLCGFLGVTCVA